MYLIKSNFRSEVEDSKVSLEEDQNVNYIYVVRFGDSGKIEANFNPETTIECNLDQRQRSSQQILDLADYLQMHHSHYDTIRRYKSSCSFTSDIPLWIELTNSNSLFDYFKGKFESNDVMLIWNEYEKPSNFNEIEKFCHQQNWRCTGCDNVRGSEASVTILYDIDGFLYEHLTRAKTRLVIVTIPGKQRYFL